MTTKPETPMPKSERHPKSQMPKAARLPIVCFGFRTSDFFRHSSFVIGISLLLPALGLDIQLPPETGAFKQDTGAEIANGQCLTCHSVEYVTMQPRMPRAFWKASVQKMQQKYGATIPDSQVEPLLDYLTKNYGVPGEGGASSASPQAANSIGATDGPQLATKYGCLGCHNASIKVVGPAYREIAAKYKADTDARTKIDEQIHKGGSGKWGPVIMPPFPQISAAETKVLTDWILSLK